MVRFPNSGMHLGRLLTSAAHNSNSHLQIGGFTADRTDTVPQRIKVGRDCLLKVKDRLVYDHRTTSAPRTRQRSSGRAHFFLLCFSCFGCLYPCACTTSRCDILHGRFGKRFGKARGQYHLRALTSINTSSARVAVDTFQSKMTSLALLTFTFHHELDFRHRL